MPLKKPAESKYGNQIYYAETNSAQPELHFDIEYDVVRHERVALGQSAPHMVAVSLSATEKQQDLAARRTRSRHRPACRSGRQSHAEGKTQPLDKARAIYDYVFTTMRYDKTGTGWGHGDVLYACDAKKGNCTDFHSLFIAMARSQGIPGRFEIGFPLPPEKHAPARSPDTIAGPISILTAKAGSPWTFPKPGSIRKSATTSSARMT